MIWMLMQIYPIKNANNANISHKRERATLQDKMSNLKLIYFLFCRATEPINIKNRISKWQNWLYCVIQQIRITIKSFSFQFQAQILCIMWCIMFFVQGQSLQQMHHIWRRIPSLESRWVIILLWYFFRKDLIHKYQYEIWKVFTIIAYTPTT